MHGRENIGRQGTWLTAGMSTDEAQRVLDRLKGRGPLSLRKPSRAWDKSLTNKIADLRLHPAVESGLHLLNDDIVSAHFVPSCHCLDLQSLTLHSSCDTAKARPSPITGTASCTA